MLASSPAFGQCGEASLLVGQVLSAQQMHVNLAGGLMDFTRDPIMFPAEPKCRGSPSWEGRVPPPPLCSLPFSSDCPLWWAATGLSQGITTAAPGKSPNHSQSWGTQSKAKKPHWVLLRFCSLLSSQFPLKYPLSATPGSWAFCCGPSYTSQLFLAMAGQSLSGHMLSLLSGLQRVKTYRTTFLLVFYWLGQKKNKKIYIYILKLICFSMWMCSAKQVN